MYSTYENPALSLEIMTEEFLAKLAKPQKQFLYQNKNLVYFLCLNFG